MTVAQAQPPLLLMTVRAAARALSLGESTIYDLIARGELPHVRVGRAKRVAMRDLEAWIERNRKQDA